MAEFTTVKKAAHDRRFRARGRSDLWMCAGNMSWSFEFKQISGGPITRGRVRDKMAQAIHCARCIHEDEADSMVAGLIVPLLYDDQRRADQVRNVLMDHVDNCSSAG